jgi:hypothetical protein
MGRRNERKIRQLQRENGDGEGIGRDDDARHEGRRTSTLTNSHKIVILHQPMPRLITVPQYLQHLCFLHLESQCPHGDFEFVVVYGALRGERGDEELEGGGVSVR